MFRSVGAVLLGYVTFAVLIGSFSVAAALALRGALPDPDAPPEPLTTKLSLAYLAAGWGFAVLAGYVTAWVARRRELAHALGLTALTVVLGALYFWARISADERPEPVWYLVANLLLPLVSFPLGGLLRARHVAARGLTAPS